MYISRLEIQFSSGKGRFFSALHKFSRGIPMLRPGADGRSIADISFRPGSIQCRACRPVGVVLHLAAVIQDHRLPLLAGIFRPRRQGVCVRISRTHELEQGGPHLVCQLPGLDAISLGPNLLEIHTTREKMDVASVERTWELVCEVLRRSKELAQ